MFIYPEIDPIAIRIGPLAVAWYGLMYLMGFIAAYFLAKSKVKQQGSPVNQKQIDDLIFYAAIGVISGGRIGYMIFYDFSTLLNDPFSWTLSLLQLWNGGMSFHGGLIGVLLAMLLFSRKVQQPFISIIDFIAPLVPIGLGLGRIGNFINGELWGKPTDFYFGFLFQGVVRHPTQLYEAFLEGLLLFVILWLFTAKQRTTGFSSAVFLILYGIFRIGIEFFRLPDSQIGYLAWNWLTLGQVLSLPMLLIGFWLFYKAKRADL
ncbi:MAG: prolipoprotein diacylglyceryl transferase [Gammaproteobacteria bacterium]|nr:prolipoprotein diacylglyceryl transferase [Gammaproteobacteria bacterium]|tara:strand:+ start:410 stop:1195 length:786 start_codon:yes stop_codon:yes gene_type:complete